eukprot:4003328-Pyramimonas_sp.AAC.1
MMMVMLEMIVMMVMLVMSLDGFIPKWALVALPGTDPRRLKTALRSLQEGPRQCVGKQQRSGPSNSLGVCLHRTRVDRLGGHLGPSRTNLEAILTVLEAILEAA